MCRSRRWLFACLVALSVAVVGTFAACGGGGGDDDNDFDFNGTWIQTLQVVQSNVPGLPVGTTLSATEIITQSGTSITIASVGLPTMAGSCDPRAGTYVVTATAGGSSFAESGTKVDEDTITGEYSETNPAFGIFRCTFTSQLASRNHAAAASTPPGRKAAF